MLVVDGMAKPSSVDKKPPEPPKITSTTVFLAIDQTARLAASDFDDEEITQPYPMRFSENILAG